MSTTGHPPHLSLASPQRPSLELDPISVLREAVAIIATGDHTSTAEATDRLLALAHSSGNHPLRVASEVRHPADSAGHPHTDTVLAAVRLSPAPASTPPSPRPRAGVGHRAGRHSIHPTRSVPPTTTRPVGAGTEGCRSVAVRTAAPQPGPHQPNLAAVDDAALGTHLSLRARGAWSAPWHRCAGACPTCRQ